MLRLPHFRWKPERVTMSSFRESEFFCKRGHLIIRGTAFLPIKSCKGVVIVSHGLNQNRKPLLLGMLCLPLIFAVDVRHPVVKVTAVI